MSTNEYRTDVFIVTTFLSESFNTDFDKFLLTGQAHFFELFQKFSYAVLSCVIQSFNSEKIIALA